MEKQFVSCRIEEGIAIVMIDNQTALNALSGPVLSQLDQILTPWRRIWKRKGSSSPGPEKNLLWPGPIFLNS